MAARGELIVSGVARVRAAVALGTAGAEHGLGIEAGSRSLRLGRASPVFVEGLSIKRLEVSLCRHRSTATHPKGQEISIGGVREISVHGGGDVVYNSVFPPHGGATIGAPLIDALCGAISWAARAKRTVTEVIRPTMARKDGGPSGVKPVVLAVGNVSVVEGSTSR